VFGDGGDGKALAHAGRKSGVGIRSVVIPASGRGLDQNRLAMLARFYTVNGWHARGDQCVLNVSGRREIRVKPVPTVTLRPCVVHSATGRYRRSDDFAK